MIFKEGLSTEIKILKVEKEEDELFLIEYDKDECVIGRYKLEDLFEPYVDKKFCKFKLEFSKEK